MVGGRNYPSGLRTTGVKVDRISTRPGTHPFDGQPRVSRASGRAVASTTVGSLRMEPCPVDSTDVAAPVPTELRSGKWSYCSPQPIYATPHREEGLFLMEPDDSCCVLFPQSPSSGGTSCRGWYPSMPLSDYCMASAPHMAYSESHIVGSAVTLSSLAHASRLSMTIPGGLVVVTPYDPHGAT